MGSSYRRGRRKPEEETTQMEQRKEQMWVTVMESMEIGWSFLQGIGDPEGITLTGPNPIPIEFDFGEYLTSALEALRTPNNWFIDDGGRLPVVCPDCTTGTNCFCDRHKGCLNCEISGREVDLSDLSGDWVDGTRLVDDSLSLDFHDMVSFLISEVNGVRIEENPRSETRDTTRPVGIQGRSSWVSTRRTTEMDLPTTWGRGTPEGLKG